MMSLGAQLVASSTHAKAKALIAYAKVFKAGSIAALHWHAPRVACDGATGVDPDLVRDRVTAAEAGSCPQWPLLTSRFAS
jgi:hypothetical protein